MTLSEALEAYGRLAPADNALSRRVYAAMPQLSDPPTREELIEWLAWNDPNGVYYDEDMLYEFGEVLTLEEAQDLFIETMEEAG
jgi:hypothetical protein